MILPGVVEMWSLMISCAQLLAYANLANATQYNTHCVVIICL